MAKQNNEKRYRLTLSIEQIDGPKGTAVVEVDEPGKLTSVVIIGNAISGIIDKMTKDE